MQKEAQVQEKLKTAFPEFNNKSNLINYYVSFDFPEKQMKMVGWWQKVIQYIIELQNRVYINYQELISYLSIYNLKPIPLPAILNYLARKEQFGPQNQYQVRQALEEENKRKQQRWINKVMSFVSKPAVKEQVFFKCQGNEMIFSRKIKEFKKQQIKKEINNIFTEHSKAVSLYKLTKTLEERVNLDRESITELLKELNREEAIKLSDQEQKPFVLYFHNQQDYRNKQLCQIEKMKFCLREAIEKFQFMIEKQDQKAKKLRERAKECLENNNKKGSLAICKEVLEKQKKIESISVRKNLLENQITQLQYNQMNKTTLTLLQEAHSIYEQTMIDQSKLDQLAEKNMEIEMSNKETHQKFENMVFNDELEEDTDAMLKELEKEVNAKKPEGIRVHVDVPMQIESGVEQKLQKKKESMQIEYN